MIRKTLPILAAIGIFLPSITYAADEVTSIEELLGAASGLVDTVQPADDSAAAAAAAPTNKKLDIGKTGLPLPRFVALKRDKVNVRKGPNESFDIAWTFTRKNLPVEIIAEYDNWRKIRDHLGEEGWVFHSLLAGSRYALVAPWEKSGHFTIHSGRDKSSSVIAKLQTGFLGAIEACDGQWCMMNAKDNLDNDAPVYKGYIQQVSLWGIYADDTIE